MVLEYYDSAYNNTHVLLKLREHILVHFNLGNTVATEINGLKISELTVVSGDKSYSVFIHSGCDGRSSGWFYSDSRAQELLV